MDTRVRRVGENEILFREVNEQIEQLNEDLGASVPALMIVCECGREDCVERITIDESSYEQVRREPTQFIVRPGHVFRDAEQVVGEGDGYVLVEKHPGAPAELAAEADPRG